MVSAAPEDQPTVNYYMRVEKMKSQAVGAELAALIGAGERARRSQAMTGDNKFIRLLHEVLWHPNLGRRYTADEIKKKKREWKEARKRGKAAGAAKGAAASSKGAAEKREASTGRREGA